MEITKIMNNGNVTGVTTSPAKSVKKDNEPDVINVSNFNTNTTNSSRVELKYVDMKEQKLEVVETRNERKVEGKVENADREARLAEIKAQIKAGEFKVNSEAIADKMIQNKDTMSMLLAE